MGGYPVPWEESSGQVSAVRTKRTKVTVVYLHTIACGLFAAAVVAALAAATFGVAGTGGVACRVHRTG